MVGRKVVVLRVEPAGEVEAPLEVIENRFPTLFESRHGELAAAMLGTTSMSLIGPSRHIALPHELGRYRDKAGVAFVASHGRVYGYAA